MSLFKKDFGRAILKLKFSYDKPNLYIPTCILNLTPGQKFETWVSSSYHMESKRCKCSSYWLHRRHLGLQDFSAYCSLLTHMKLKCKAMDFKTLGFSLKYFNLILIHLVTPAQVTQERTCKPTGWDERSLFLHEWISPSKLSKLCMKFGLRVFRLTEKLTTPTVRLYKSCRAVR